MFIRALGAVLVLGLGAAGAAVGSARAADDTAVVKLAIVVPLVVPASADEFLSSAQLGLYTSERGLLTRELDAVLNRPVAIGIDPRIIASIRLLGSSAPPSALAWLDRLAGATNQAFALAYADADLTLQTQAGGDVLQPETFDFAIDPSLFAAAPSTATPGPTGAPGGPTVPELPTSEQLVEWPYLLTGIAWPRDDSAVASDLPAITAAGYTTTILSSSNVSRDAASGPSAQVDGSGVVVADAAVSEGLRAASSAITPTDWAAAAAGLSAAISAGSRVQSGSPTMVAALDRTAALTGSRLADTLDALAADPAVELIPFSRVLAIEPSTATVIDEPQDADRLSRVGQMIQGENAERAFASVADDPAAITSQRRLELLTLLSAEWSGGLGTWAESADAFTTASIALRNSVHLVESSNFLLVADNDQYLPITVNNSLDQPVTVYITVRSQSSLLTIDDARVELPLEAGAQAKKNIPVHSLSNGVVEVDVSLSSASGVPIGAPISSEVNVQAGWETPIIIAVAALVVVVFGVGVVRTVLRRRRMSRLEADHD